MGDLILSLVAAAFMGAIIGLFATETFIMRPELDSLCQRYAEATEARIIDDQWVCLSVTEVVK